MRLLTFAFLSSLACTPSMPASGPHEKLGQGITLSLPTSEGSLLTIPTGATVVLDFFGPTCAPCRKSVPELVAQRQRLANKGATLRLIAVLADGETSEQAERVLASWGGVNRF
jgi:thiol-disulfide isomerase/thioredoxin